MVRTIQHKIKHIKISQHIPLWKKSTKQREIFARVLTSHKARITRIVPVRLEAGRGEAIRLRIIFYAHSIFFIKYFTL